MPDHLSHGPDSMPRGGGICLGPAAVRSRAGGLLTPGPPSGEIDCEASQANTAGSDLIPQSEPFTVKRLHLEARPHAKEIDCILGSV